MSEGKKKAKKKTKKKLSRGKAGSSKKKAMSLRQAREEAVAKKKRKKSSKKKSSRKKQSEVTEAVTSAAENAIEEIQSRATPAAPVSPEAAANIDDPNLAANKAAETVEPTPEEVITVSPGDAWAIRHHMKAVGKLPVNLRRRRYQALLSSAGVSDSLYYRNHANVSLDQSELISLMSVLYGKCKEETMAAMAEFYKRFPDIEPNTIDRCIKFKNGESFVVSHHDLSEMETDPKKLKSTVTKIRNSIVSRIQERRALEKALSQRESRA